MGGLHRHSPVDSHQGALGAVLHNAIAGRVVRYFILPPYVPTPLQNRRFGNSVIKVFRRVFDSLTIDVVRELKV